MKSLKECIQMAMATPMNTIGMGNVDMSTDGLAIASVKRKIKRLKRKKKTKK